VISDQLEAAKRKVHGKKEDSTKSVASDKKPVTSDE
jgi:hypothetical protein